MLGPGGLTSGGAVKTIIDLSTSGPAASARIASALAPEGIAWVEAPVSGGVKGAREGSLAVMVACPAAVRAEAESLLRTFGRIFYTGEKPGLAQTAKLANNLLGAAAIAITAEACAFGVKAGLDAAVLIDIINAGSGLNTASRDKFPRAVLTRTFDFGFATGLSHKDVQPLPRRGGGARGAHGGGCRGPPDAGHHERKIRPRLRLHVDREGRGGVGRCGDQRMNRRAS